MPITNNDFFSYICVNILLLKSKIVLKISIHSCAQNVHFYHSRVARKIQILDKRVPQALSV